MRDRNLYLMVAVAVTLVILVIVNDDAYAKTACDRACLKSYTIDALTAMVAHDPKRLPLARDIIYTENAQHLAPGDGLWATLENVTDKQLYLADVDTGQGGFFGVIKENGLKAILFLRVRVEQKRITEMEAVIARSGGLIFNPDGVGASFDLMREKLKPKERASTAEMVRITNSYFNAIEQNDGRIAPFDKECNRTENGTQTTNNTTFQRPPEQGFSVLSYGCTEQLSTGFFQYLAGIRPREILMVDEERGVVLGIFMFQHPGRMQKVTIKDVGEVDLPPFAKTPFTLLAAEMFKIKNKKIRRIEAVMVRLPYGAGTGWD